MLIKNMHRNESLSDYMQKLFIPDPPQNEMYFFFLLLVFEVRDTIHISKWSVGYEFFLHNCTCNYHLSYLV